jgi:hypothetical protein
MMTEEKWNPPLTSTAAAQPNGIPHLQSEILQPQQTAGILLLRQTSLTLPFQEGELGSALQSSWSEGIELRKW